MLCASLEESYVPYQLMQILSFIYHITKLNGFIRLFARIRAKILLALFLYHPCTVCKRGLAASSCIFSLLVMDTVHDGFERRMRDEISRKSEMILCGFAFFIGRGNDVESANIALVINVPPCRRILPFYQVIE